MFLQIGMQREFRFQHINASLYEEKIMGYRKEMTDLGDFHQSSEQDLYITWEVLEDDRKGGVQTKFQVFTRSHPTDIKWEFCYDLGVLDTKVDIWLPEIVERYWLYK